jgi:hypothetical protein
MLFFESYNDSVSTAETNVINGIVHNKLETKVEALVVLMQDTVMDESEESRKRNS